MEFLSGYGLFLAQAITIVVSIIVLVAVIAGISQRGKRSEKGHVDVFNLNDVLENTNLAMKEAILDEEMLKVEAKAQKKQDKETQKKQKEAAKDALKEAKKAGKAAAGSDTATETESRKQRVFVIDFDGDVQASEVENLRQEVSAILSVAEAMDEVVIRLESPGGMVHGYGLAASQLSRITAKGITLTVAVDMVAASGGYMMACIGDKIIAAPFALLGSIGVVAQVPNFHRLLKSKEIDVEILTAGKHKRTMTMFGENTEAGREKFIDELEDVHSLFKDFVAENRSVVDVEAVATGEAWYGKRALENKLVDELKTSDEYIIDRCDEADVYLVRYSEEQNRVDRILDRFSARLTKILGREDLQFQGPYKF